MMPGDIDHVKNVNHGIVDGPVDPGGVELQSVLYCRRASLETLGDPNEHGSSLLSTVRSTVTLALVTHYDQPHRAIWMAFLFLLLQPPSHPEKETREK